MRKQKTRIEEYEETYCDFCGKRIVYVSRIFRGESSDEHEAYPIEGVDIHIGCVEDAIKKGVGQIKT